MSFAQEKAEFSPILYFLENDKISDLIRVMFSRKVSEEYLLRYGNAPEVSLKKSDEIKIEDYLRRFDLKQIVHLKGSDPNNVKYHTNSFLEECFRRKLRRQGMFTPQQRKCAWLQLTQYYQLPTLFSGLKEVELPHPLQQAIKKDVCRTLLGEDILDKMEQSKREQRNLQMRRQLTTILQAFAKYNPYIGYCQGMNNVVLFLIEEGFSDHQAFFILKKITQELLPCDYYSTMNSVIGFVKLLCQVLSQTHPQVVKVMRVVVKNNCGDGISLTTSFAIQWFVCLFTNTNLSRDMRRCIMDHFLLQGMPALLKAALCFFDAIAPKISQVKYFQQYNPIVEKTIRQYTNLKHLYQCFNEKYINKAMLGLILQKLRPPSQKRRKYEPKNSCKWQWTMCLNSVEEQLSEGNSYQFFVFKTAEEPKIINNYFEAKDKNYYFRIGKYSHKAGQLRLGRMNHTCRPPSGTSQTEDMESRNELQATTSSHSKSVASPNSKAGDKWTQLQEPQKREFVRNRALKQLQSLHEGRKAVLAHSESVQFMKQMIQNQSFSNLIEILEVEQMDNLFKDCISQNEDEQNSP